MRVAVCLFVLSSSVLFVACEREERGFRVNPPDANRVESKQVSTLRAGLNPPAQPANNEYEENAFALNQGKQLFEQMNCTGCHAHGGGAIGPPLMDDKWIYGSQPEQIFSTIVEGRPNGMPSFHGKLPDYQVWQLAAYVRSMSGQANRNAAPGRPDDMHATTPENSTKPEPPKSGGKEPQ